MTRHDSTYHKLFSNPAMVADLVRHFVDEPWVADLDLTRMTRVNARFHADHDQRRDGDVIWRIPTQSGQDLYLYLLLEFQSRSDRWMALRIMVYVGLLWQHLVREKRIPADGLLPPVLPVVIYNGDPPWRSPVQLDALIQLPEESLLWKYQPRARYYLLDQGRFGADDLGQRHAMSALLFRLEHCREPMELVGILDELIHWFDHYPEFDSIKKVMGELVGHVAATVGADPMITQREELQEVRVMLATRMAAWKEQFRQEAMLEGRQEGRQEGLREDAVEFLLRLLHKRFDSVPPWIEEKIRAADRESVLLWGERLLEVRTLEELFQ